MVEKRLILDARVRDFCLEKEHSRVRMVNWALGGIFEISEEVGLVPNSLVKIFALNSPLVHHTVLNVPKMGVSL